MKRTFTLVEEITSKESEDFHNGRVECFDIEGQDVESIVEGVFRKYEARKEEFKNNEIYVDNCSLFVVKYNLTIVDPTGNRNEFTLWSDSYHENEDLCDSYICESHLKATLKMSRKLKKFIESYIPKKTNLTVKTYGKIFSVELREDEYWIVDIARKVHRAINEEIAAPRSQYWREVKMYSILERMVVQKGKTDEYLKLEEGRTLADYNIRNKDTIYLLGPHELPIHVRERCFGTINCSAGVENIESSLL